MEREKWRESVGVVRKVPLIRQIVSFWATCKVWMMHFEVCSENQTRELNIRTGRMIV